MDDTTRRTIPSLFLSGVLAVILLSACSAAQPEGAGGPDASMDGQRVIAMIGDRALTFQGPAVLSGECVGGHRGFTAHAQDERLQLYVFIFNAGTFRCGSVTPGEPDPFIYMSWSNRNPTGEYVLSPTSADPGGACEIVVDSVRPRFKAHFSGTLPRTMGDAGPLELPVTADIDVIVPEASGCS